MSFFKEIKKQNNDYHISRYSTKSFLEINKERFKNIDITASFSDEYLNEVKKSNSQNVTIESLNLIKSLGIKHLRIGLRWKNIQKENDKLDISSYLPILNWCIKEGIKITLNVGPIKTFRWPEEHIPEFFSDLFHLKKDRIITAFEEVKRFLRINIQDEYRDIEQNPVLKGKAVEYISKLLPLLKKVEGLDSIIDTIQIENEGFNIFGEFGISLNKYYIFQILSIVEKYYPDKKILFNSAGPRDLFAIHDVFKSYAAIKELPDMSKFTIGYNYYYLIPSPLNILNLIFNLADPIVTSELTSQSITILKDLAEKEKFNLEITEAQFEPWGVFHSPGNSANDFKYMIQRCARILPSKGGAISLWGIEKFVDKFLDKTNNFEHDEIRKIILNLQNNFDTRV